MLPFISNGKSYVHEGVQLHYKSWPLMTSNDKVINVKHPFMSQKWTEYEQVLQLNINKKSVSASGRTDFIWSDLEKSLLRKLCLVV